MENHHRVSIELKENENLDEKTFQLLEKYKNGEISIDSLMGPLFGMPDLTSSITIPNGEVCKAPSAPDSGFSPKDQYNIELEKNIHPPDYVNPESTNDYDIVVIGAGVAGLISVIIGSWLGKKCALIERHGMGGDCLNTGCVPSKALIACARKFYDLKSLDEFGIYWKHNTDNLDNTNSSNVTPVIDFNKVMSRMRSIRSKISHHDSVQRYSREFCKHVFIGDAKFTSPNTIEVKSSSNTADTRIIYFKKCMIATGASASVPTSIPGLLQSPHLTNGNFFNLTELPPRMVVIGCGPIGMELAQSMSRFGCKVTCLEVSSQLLSREDQDAVAVLKQQLESEGITIYTNVKIVGISCKAPSSSSSTTIPDDANNHTILGMEGGLYNAPWNQYTVRISIPSAVVPIVDGNNSNGISTTITTINESKIHIIELESDCLLNATGRSPNVAELGLEQVGVFWDNRKGVHTNEYFQTANPDIYACGDCASPYRFTHSADFQARAAVRNMFLGHQVRMSDMLIPWCTYTDPEIAHVGKYEKELDSLNIKYESFIRHFKDVDRCICDGITAGFVKITILSGTDKIIGATICGENAGDMISEITVCMQYDIGITQLAGTIHPYPTQQEAIRQACLGFNKYLKNSLLPSLATLKLIMSEKENSR